jgi:transposase-like protein
VEEPWRRWGQRTGVLGVWARWEAGRKVLRRLSPTHSESEERWLEGSRGVVKRGRQTPVTITPGGAVGLTKAMEARWPQSKRMRWWLHRRQNLRQKVPPPAWPEFTALSGDRREAPTREKAEERRDASVARYQRAGPDAGRC